MEIKFVFNKRNFSICFGYETSWFSQIPFITFSEEFYDNREVVFATFIWTSPYKR